MNKAHQPPDPPPGEGTSPDPDKEENVKHGVPAGAEDAEPKGQPTSDRHKTETVPAKT